MEPRIRTRFAPSPTGAMHLGHVRTHLAAWLVARTRGGRVVMRIEDLDGPRVRRGAEDALLRDHAWLGLDWDEGPFRQSERTAHYEEALTRLVARGAVYPCTCSRKEIEAIASAPHGDDGPIYPGTCRAGPTHPERAHAYRFRMPDAVAPWTDGIRGVVPGAIGNGDFVVQRADGVFAYQLAVVVDDAAMAITHVVRGDDLVPSTPKQLAIFEALGEPAPAYAHLPLVRGADGERLAKRHGARAIADYREGGVTHERVLGALGWSLGLVAGEAPRAATLDELRAALVERAGSSDGDAPDVLRGLRVALHEPGATGRMPEALAWLESWLES